MQCRPTLVNAAGTFFGCCSFIYIYMMFWTEVARRVALALPPLRGITFVVENDVKPYTDRLLCCLCHARSMRILSLPYINNTMLMVIPLSGFEGVGGSLFLTAGCVPSAKVGYDHRDQAS